MFQIAGKHVQRCGKQSICGRAFIFVSIMIIGLMFVSANAIAAEKGPIKIGFIAPFTGNFAQIGKDMVEGLKMYLEEINYEMAGRKVELIVEDEGGNPAIAVNKARKLVTLDKVDLVAGVFMTSAAYAVAPVLEEAKTPLLISLSAGDDLTQRKRSKYLKRISFTGSELGMVAADYTYNKLGWRKAICFAFDYAWGHENIGAFQRVFEKLGGQVIQKVWTPVNTADFGPYVASLKHNADGIYDVITGGASIRFIKAVRSAGPLKNMAIITPGTGTDETLLPAMGKVGIGVMSVFPWSAALDNPENKEWSEKVQKKFNRGPTLGMALNYDAGRWINAAVIAVNGNVEDKDAFMKALSDVRMQKSLRGPLSLDKYGHVVQDIYIRKVEEKNGVLQNTIIDVYPQSTQFFTYDPEEYLKTPVGSRDWPPCKYCD
jgi:branched-chain amino acid transport system substrate-binding protein